MSDKRKSSPWLWVVAGFGLLVLYVLSFACVGWLAHHNYVAESVAKPIEAFYLPIMWIAERIEPIKSFFIWVFTLG